MDQQQNGQRRKGPQQNRPHQSGRTIKSCTHFCNTFELVTPGTFTIRGFDLDERMVKGNADCFNI